MSEKRKKITDVSCKKKSRSHKLCTFETKMDIIKRAEGGESGASIGRFYNLSRSTVCSILKNKNKIKEYVQNAGNISSKIVSKKRGIVMDEMERSLTMWIEDQHQKNIPLSLSIIQEKALSLYEDWKKQLSNSESTASTSTPEFRASKGWFDNFKARASLHNIKLTGESASADKEAAAAFITSFAKLIKEKDYSLHQIFNVDETGLFWKKMPARTYLAKENAVAPGHKACKDRLTLLLGGNAAGDFKLKPMLVAQSENPRALKGKDKRKLPVIWKSNSKAWVTGTIFQDWFVHHFVPSVKEYCSTKNLAFKVLLILDNAPGHPKTLQNLCPEIEVVFLPPNTTCEIQPMDQSVIATFKRYYLRRSMNQALKAIDKDDARITLREFWKNYNIWNAINNIGDSWAEIKESTLKGSWKKLCPQIENNFEDLQETAETLTTEIMDIMNELSLGVDRDDINELIASDSEPMSNEDLIHFQEVNQTEVEQDEDECLEVKTLTVQNMGEAFLHLEKFLSIIEECDPNGERSSQVRRAIERDTSCYRVMYQEKKRQATVQLSLDNFFKPSHSMIKP